MNKLFITLGITLSGKLCNTILRLSRITDDNYDDDEEDLFNGCR
jgi:hypothetical protein